MRILVSIIAMVFVGWLNNVHAMDYEKKYGNWTSGVITNDSGTTVYRAVSDVERKTRITVFFALDLLSDCATYIPNMLLYIPEGVDSSGYLNLGEFQARVDTKQVIKGAWTSSSNEMGDKVVFISLLSKEQSNLISDLKLGNTLRVKLSFLDQDKDDVYFNFSLKGSSASIDRSSLLCEMQSGGEEKYFRQDKKEKQIKPEKKDSEYFL